MIKKKSYDFVNIQIRPETRKVYQELSEESGISIVKLSGMAADLLKRDLEHKGIV